MSTDNHDLPQVDNFDDLEEGQLVPSQPEHSESTQASEESSDDDTNHASEHVPHFTPNYVNPKVTVEDKVIEALAEPASRFIFAIGTTIGEALRFIESGQNVRPTGNATERSQFETTLNGAMGDTHYAHDDLQQAADSPTADWKQYIEHGGGKYRLSKPPYAVQQGSASVVSGSQATLLLEQLRGIGQTVTVPLPHSGIWLTLRSAKLAALTQLDSRLANEKSKLGRLSRGYAFSNDGVITNEIIFDFIMAHTVDCNLQNWSPELLATIIRVQDLSILAHAMSCTMYPKGFPYAQACTVDAEKCVHVTKAKLNLTKMFWTDNNKLSSTQKARLAARKERIAPSVLDTFHSSALELSSSVISLDNVRLFLHTPTIRQHIDSGTAWLADVEEMTESAVTQVSDEVRADFMLTQGMATRLAAVAHWVKEIRMDLPTADGETEEKVVEDAATIRALLRDLSSTTDDREKIMDGVMKFINDSTVSIIAIPNYPCENCKKWQRTIDGPNSALIPFDPINTFFTLQQFRLMEAQDQGII